MNAIPAFALRAGYDDASVNLPDGTTFRVSEHLDDGHVFTDDPVLISALEKVVALEAVEARDDVTPVRVSDQTPTTVQVDPAVAGLSGAANSGLPVDAFGNAVTSDPIPGVEGERPAGADPGTQEDGQDVPPVALSRQGLDALSRDRLRDLARERDLPTSGSKQELIDRLAPGEDHTDPEEA